MKLYGSKFHKVRKYNRKLYPFLPAVKLFYIKVNFIDLKFPCGLTQYSYV